MINPTKPTRLLSTYNPNNTLNKGCSTEAWNKNISLLLFNI